MRRAADGFRRRCSSSFHLFCFVFEVCVRVFVGSFVRQPLLDSSSSPIRCCTPFDPTHFCLLVSSFFFFLLLPPCEKCALVPSPPPFAVSSTGASRDATPARHTLHSRLIQRTFFARTCWCVGACSAPPLPLPLPHSHTVFVPSQSAPVSLECGPPCFSPPLPPKKRWVAPTRFGRSGAPHPIPPPSRMPPLLDPVPSPSTRRALCFGVGRRPHGSQGATRSSTKEEENAHRMREARQEERENEAVCMCGGGWTAETGVCLQFCHCDRQLSKKAPSPSPSPQREKNKTLSTETGTTRVWGVVRFCGQPPSALLD